MRTLAAFLLGALCAGAETRTLTLRQTIDLALSQSPEILLARLDAQKARDQVIIAKDPFIPKVYAGSGAAWSSGFPASIDGAAPSIFQTKTQMSLFDRPQSYQIAQANENLRGSEIDVAKQQDEVVYRVASLFLDAEQAARSMQAAQRESENLARALDLVSARVADGRALPIESRKANLALRGAKNTVESLALNLVNAETTLAVALGLNPDDRVRAAAEDRAPLMLPESEEATIENAIESSNEIRRLESSLQAKTLEIKGYKAARLPKINLVAQYELFAKYYYQNYYPVFTRNSVQLGASFEVPLLIGRSSSAYVSQAETDIARLRIQIAQTRSRISADLRRGFQEIRRADSARDYAREALEVSREQLTIDLAQNEEGRLPMSAVEQDRAAEQEKWLAFYDAQHVSERARLNLLRQTGTLQAALR
jgi:outer membrane protein